MSITAKDVQALRQATGAGMMDAKKALEETDGDFDAAAKWLREKGLAKSVDRADRENTAGRRRRRRPTATSPPSSSSSARPTSSPSPTSSSPCSRSSPTPSPPTARAPSTRARTSVDDLKVTLKENIDVGRVVPHRGRRRQRRRHLPAQAGRAAASTPCSSSSTAATPELAHEIAVSHRLHQAAVPHPRRGARGRGRRGARDARGHHPGRGQARAGDREDRRGPAQRLVQGPGAARAAVRQGRQAVDHPAARRRRASSASPRSYIGVLTLPRPPGPAGPAEAVRRGVRRQRRATASTARSAEFVAGEIVEARVASASTSPSSSAAATSGGA